MEMNELVFRDGEAELLCLDGGGEERVEGGGIMDVVGRGRNEEVEMSKEYDGVVEETDAVVPIDGVGSFDITVAGAAGAPVVDIWDDGPAAEVDVIAADEEGDEEA